MLDIEFELNEDKEKFISLYSFIDTLMKESSCDLSSVYKWVIRRMNKETNLFTVDVLFIYKLNEFDELVLCYSDPYEILRFIKSCLLLAVHNDCLPVEEIDVFENEPGSWSNGDFFVYGFKKDDLFKFFPEVKEYFDGKCNNRGYEKNDGVDNCANTKSIEMLEKENESLRERVNQLEKERPILLRAYRDDDPLYLAIEIRNREWANYDPENDFSTRGNQEAITTELKKRIKSDRIARAIELVACPIKR